MIKCAYFLRIKHEIQIQNHNYTVLCPLPYTYLHQGLDLLLTDHFEGT